MKAQNSSELEKRWNKTQREIEFGKDPNKKEPRDWWSNSPHYVSEDGTVSDQEEASSQDFEEHIKRSRKGSGKNSKKEMKKTEMAEPPEFDPPEINEPDIDVDAPDPTKISQSTWRMHSYLFHVNSSTFNRAGIDKVETRKNKSRIFVRDEARKH